ncbi:type II toxin-antitoxin system Phd/YefM family antitoxin [Spirillospora sp. CA-294931]|uniref:type II toxin-antitoxin system Phd/YefM family antitoxin n=1 Tax=Spirillospora sp. CA-294931 TaxID=3240042 RepID=UPI003D8EEE07
MTEARAQLADLVNRVAYTGEPIRLTRRGRPMVALISAEDLELLELIKSERIDLTQTGASGQGERQGQPRPAQPLRIAAEYRPPGPPRPPGFTR